MKRILAVAAVMFVMRAPAQAEDAKPFYLNRDGTVEQRLDTVTTEVEKLRGDVDMLRTEVSRLKGSAEAKAPAKPKAVIDATQIVYQVCTNGKCQNFVTDDIAKVPLGAKILSQRAVTAEPVSAGSPCPTGPCGDNCQCASMLGSASSSDGGERVGIWFPGKRILSRICNR